jgi:hypothetical protein
MTSAFGPIRWAKSVPAIRRADGRVDSTAHHVLLALATYAHRDGTGARPSVETLAEDCRLTPRYVADAIKRIAAAGLISEMARLDGGITVWRLHLDVIDSGPSVVESQQARRRALAAERQRKHRERKASNAPARRDVTLPHGVTDEGVSRRATASRNAVDSVTSRRAAALVTPPRASQPQVTPHATALELPVELPKELSPAPQETSDADAFDAFWAAYPRKIGKGQARTAWARAVKRADPATIIAAANEFGIERGNQDPKFTPYPATWLNGERWTDEPAKPQLRVVGEHRPWGGYDDQSVYDEDI